MTEKKFKEAENKSVEIIHSELFIHSEGQKGKD